jgi:hypothetical protein
MYHIFSAKKLQAFIHSEALFKPQIENRLNQFQHESTLLILGASEYQDWNLSGFVRFIVDWKMVITGYYNLISFQSSIESEPKVRLKKNK